RHRERRQPTARGERGHGDPALDPAGLRAGGTVAVCPLLREPRGSTATLRVRKRARGARRASPPAMRGRAARPPGTTQKARGPRRASDRVDLHGPRRGGDAGASLVDGCLAWEERLREAPMKPWLPWFLPVGSPFRFPLLAVPWAL